VDPGWVPCVPTQCPVAVPPADVIGSLPRTPGERTQCARRTVLRGSRGVRFPPATRLDQVVCGPRIRNLFVLLRHRGRPRSGLPDDSVGLDVCTNPTPWPAWAPAPLARSEALADRATSTYTNKGQHGRDAATTWASAARTCSPARCMPPSRGRSRPADRSNRPG